MAMAVPATGLGDFVVRQGRGFLAAAIVVRNLAGLAAAGLILAEIALLGSGVFARYVLNRPIIWVDELTLILFAWLSMSGAVLALMNRQHMRLTFLVTRASERWQRRFETLDWTVLACVLAVLLFGSFHYAVESWPEFTAALRISLAWRTAAIPCGFGLMLVVSLLRLGQVARPADLLWSVGVVVIVAGVFRLATDVLEGMGDLNLLVFFGVLVLALIFAGVEIAFAFALAALAYVSLMTSAPVSIVANRLDAAITDPILLSIPMFVFLGVLIEFTGIAGALIGLMIALLGHVRGGLHYVLLGAMYLVSGISGSKSADMAAIAPILLPEMKRRGESEGELVALLSTSAAMAETIPPSIILIAVGVSAGVSISDLFVGGLLPAGVGLLVLAAMVFMRSRGQDRALSARPSGGRVLKAAIAAVPALVLPFLIRTAVIEGVATATEVATVGVFYSVLCGVFVYRRFPLDHLYPALLLTASLTGAILLVTGLAGGMAWALAQTGFSENLVILVQNIPGGAPGFLFASIVFFAVLGSILEGFPAIVMFAPIMFPIAHELGINGVHYAMVVVLSMSIGLFSPPFGVGFYSACTIGGVSPDRAMRDIWVYMAGFVVSVVIVAAVPFLSTCFLN